MKELPKLPSIAYFYYRALRMVAQPFLLRLVTAFSMLMSIWLANHWACPMPVITGVLAHEIVLACSMAGLVTIRARREFSARVELARLLAATIDHAENEAKKADTRAN